MRKDLNIDEVSIKLYQEGNTLGSTSEYEILEVRFEYQTLEDGPFMVFKTDGWSIDSLNEFKSDIDEICQKLYEKGKLGLAIKGSSFEKASSNSNRLEEELQTHIDHLRRLADDTERDVSEDDKMSKERKQFYDGRVACLREEISNLKDVFKSSQEEPLNFEDHIEDHIDVLLKDDEEDEEDTLF